MKLNDVLTKLNLISKLVLENDGKSLSKELKVKVMRVRMAYNKIKKQFDQDLEEFTKELVPEDLRELANKQDKTEEELAIFNEKNAKINSEYNEFVMQKGSEEVSDEISDKFTEEEYFDIVDINSANDVEINGNKIKAADFLEIIYELFVA